MSWYGAERTAEIIRAMIVGVNKTTSDATIVAKNLVHRDTATLQRSIYPEPAVHKGATVEGIFGPHDVAYAVFQEFLPGEQMPDGGKRERSGGKPYMRPAYEIAKKKLIPNIRAAYRGGA